MTDSESHPAARSPATLRGWIGAWPVLIPVFFAVWTYRDALHGAFVMDDIQAIVQNTSLETIGGFWDAAFGAKHSAVSNRPLVCLTLALNYAVNVALGRGGLDTFEYHLFNLIVHVANVALLWAVARRTFRSPALADYFAPTRAMWTATAIAAIWAVHPLVSEAVVYITQRTTLLASFFILLMIYAALRSAVQTEHAMLWKIIAVGSCALAMLSKEEAVAAPILLVLFDRAFLFDSFKSARAARGAMYGCLAGTWILLVACVVAGPHNPTVGYHTSPQANPWEWLLTQAPVLVRYIRLAFWPRPLSAAYDWEIVRHFAEVWWQALIVLAIMAASALLWRHKPHWGWLGAMFFLLLAPTSSFLPIVSEIVAERRMYLPMLAVLIPVVLGLIWIMEFVTTSIRGANGNRVAWMAVPFLVLALVASHEAASRAAAFADEYTVWTDAKSKNELKNGSLGTSNILTGYSSVLLRRGQFAQAIPLLEVAVYQCRPFHPNAMINLAAAYADAGRPDQAEQLYQQIFNTDSKNADAFANYARLLIDRYQNASPEDQRSRADPRLQKANELLRHALLINPRQANYWNNLGMASYYLGDIDEADRAWQSALQIEPRNLSALTNRGMVLLASGKIAEGAAMFEQLRQIEPKNADVYTTLAEAYKELGQDPLARQRLNEAARLAPADPRVKQLQRLWEDPTGSNQ